MPGGSSYWAGLQRARGAGHVDLQIALASCRNFHQFHPELRLVHHLESRASLEIMRSAMLMFRPRCCSRCWSARRTAAPSAPHPADPAPPPAGPAGWVAPARTAQPVGHPAPGAAGPGGSAGGAWIRTSLRASACQRQPDAVLFVGVVPNGSPPGRCRQAAGTSSAQEFQSCRPLRHKPLLPPLAGRPMVRASTLGRLQIMDDTPPEQASGAH